MIVKPKKSLGQNFLNNIDVLSRIVDEGKISNKDIILEIGPGTGNLTEKILEKNPKELIVIEKDNYLSDLLKKKFGNNINIINDDILKCYKHFKYNAPIKVFGNLPYNISTKILTLFAKTENLHENYKKFIFVFQKEVAERIISNENSKNYGRLSILTSWKMRREKIFDISPDNFFPKPKIWSSLITLEPKSNFKILKNDNTLEHVTNIFFNQRRKMIKNPMKQLFKDFNQIALKLNINLEVRPQNISKQKYLEICEIYESLN